MDHLPDEILLAIFQRIDVLERSKLACISKRWHRIIQGSYHNIETLSMASTLAFRSTACLEKFHVALRLCGRFLRELNLDLDRRFLDRSTLDVIRQQCSQNLVRLHLKNISIDQTEFLELLGSFRGKIFQ